MLFRVSSIWSFHRGFWRRKSPTTGRPAPGAASPASRSGPRQKLPDDHTIAAARTGAPLCADRPNWHVSPHAFARHARACVSENPCAIISLVATYKRFYRGVERFMSLPKTEKIWHNGKFIHWDDAKIHVLSHVVNYGSAVFEGIRCYDDAAGPGDLPPARTHAAPDELRRTSIAWSRPSRSTNSRRPPRTGARQQSERLLHPSHRAARLRRHRRGPARLSHRGLSWPVGNGENISAKKRFAQGVDVCVSSWNRPAPNTLPQMAKAAANYMNSQLIHMEAKVERLRRRHRARHERLRERRLRRKHFRGDERHACSRRRSRTPRCPASRAIRL